MSTALFRTLMADGIEEHKAPMGAARKEPRHILIISPNSCPGIEVELMRNVFEEANRIPNRDREYSVEHLVLNEAGYSADEPHKPLALTRGCKPHDFTFDTIIITASHEVVLSHLDSETLSQLKNYCSMSHRVIALAGGVLYLAAMEILRGRVVVTHWSLHRQLEKSFPSVSVRSDILYNRDGKIYTCAGALASVDLGLQLVEDDLGRVATAHVSERMLLSHRRTSVCNQVSSTLKAQNNVSHPISDLLAWLPNQLASDLSILKLAQRVAMSPRNFSRRFHEQVKKTPGRYIEELRFEVAKRELARKECSVAEAASRSGLNNAESLRRLFHRRLGGTPKTFRDEMASF